MTYQTRLLLASTLAAAAIAGQVVAQERLNFAYGYPQASAVGLGVDEYSAAVAERSGGAIEVTGFPMSLLSLPETSPGVRDGLADVGFVLPPYYPADYSVNLFLHEMNPMISLVQDPTGDESLAFAGAMLEYTMTNCPECLSEYKAQNQVYTGGGVTPIYSLLCRDAKITTIEDLKGKRLRAGGAGFVRFAEHFGAQGVRIPVSEAYEALDQGIIDCAMLSAQEMTNYSLHEVVTDVTIGVPGGVFAGISSANVNLDRWNGLDDAGREALLWGGATMTAAITWIARENDDKAIEHARDKGIAIHMPDAELVAAIEEFVAQDLKTVSTLFEETYNVERASEISADFEPLLEKWYGLVTDVDSLESLSQLYWTEVISTVDPASYGK
jgi:TRAP-type C4-dicarboxylate transport system substrate-binding protein